MSENADDEGLMMKLLKYAKKLAAKKVDPTLMTKEELFTRVDEAKKGPLLPTGITMTNSLKAMSF